MDVQKQDDQHEPTYSNYVRTQDVTLKTCRRRWMIGRSGERGSGISMLAAQHDHDDDTWIWFFIQEQILWSNIKCLWIHHPWQNMEFNLASWSHLERKKKDTISTNNIVFLSYYLTKFVNICFLLFLWIQHCHVCLLICI